MKNWCLPMLNLSQTLFVFLRNHKRTIVGAGAVLFGIPVLSFLLRKNGFTLHRVQGPSMFPTLNSGHLVLTFLILINNFLTKFLLVTTDWQIGKFIKNVLLNCWARFILSKINFFRYTTAIIENLTSLKYTIKS